VERLQVLDVEVHGQARHYLPPFVDDKQLFDANGKNFSLLLYTVYNPHEHPVVTNAETTSKSAEVHARLPWPV
jgi:hypothetical protein